MMQRDVAGFDELVSGTATRVEVDGIPIAVVRIDDEVYAVGDTCTHANVSLSEGEVWCEAKQLECPRHGAAFDLIDGAPTSLPATQPVAVFPVDVVDGRVVVTVPQKNAYGDEPGGE